MENNSYVLECPVTHEALLVDACFEADSLIAKSEGARIIGVLQTHGHMDHVQALVELKDKLGVPVYAHPGDRYPGGIDREVSDGDVVSFGEREARVIHTPGHTPGGSCFLIGCHLFSGDTLFPGGPGNTRRNPVHFATIIRSIQQRLFTLPDDTIVLPGHGDDTTVGAERPHLQEWIDRGW